VTYYADEGGAMTRYGYTLPREDVSVPALIHQAVLAEQVGFDFLVFSDQYHAMSSKQGWEVLASIASATKRIQLVVVVMYPNVRYPQSSLHRLLRQLQY
jgi:alkanesulfonate monooxygenase SsuD/methylene tetrahydromethanopterin reductase-like flavin-dependent oxidoreductase (luciferase family)